MSEKTFLPAGLYDYVRRISLREPEILKRLREETAQLPLAEMQIPPEQGQLMALLVTLTGARKALEIGVFTGYSSLAVALAMPMDSELIALDVSEEYTAIARRYWREAGVDQMIELRLKPALDSAQELLKEGHGGSFDFAFIDADKPNYPGYYEAALELVRTGGLILIDNVLQRGKVADASNQERNVVAMRAFNESLKDDPRIWLSVLPVADGLTLAVKR